MTVTKLLNSLSMSYRNNFSKQTDYNDKLVNVYQNLESLTSQCSKITGKLTFTLTYLF